MTDDEIKQLVVSNAQAIQGLSRDISRLVETQQEAAKERQEAAKERQELRQLIESTARAIQANADKEAQERQAAAKERQELRQLIEGNARAIQANADKEAQERQQLRQLIEANARAIQAHVDSSAADRAQMKEAIITLTNIQQGMANLLGSLDEDRPTILRRLMSIENKVDRLLEKEQRDE